MIINKKIALILSCLLILALLSTVIPNTIENISVSANLKCIPTVIIDAGHGGFDGGAEAIDGTVEKDINLIIALRLASHLNESGFNVVMTRTADVSTDDVESDKIAVRKKSDLKNRLNLMKDYHDGIFVSIHLNKFTTSAAWGSQVFYGAKNSDSKNLSDYIQKSIVSRIQPENTRVNKQATSSTYILFNATIPSALVECGFLSNKTDLELLKDKGYQSKMAFCIYCGILDYFSKPKGV